jgi:hypothetical protein
MRDVDNRIRRAEADDDQRDHTDVVRRQRGQAVNKAERGGAGQGAQGDQSPVGDASFLRPGRQQAGAQVEHQVGGEHHQHQRADAVRGDAKQVRQ